MVGGTQGAKQLKDERTFIQLLEQIAVSDAFYFRRIYKESEKCLPPNHSSSPTGAVAICPPRRKKEMHENWQHEIVRFIRRFALNDCQVLFIIVRETITIICTENGARNQRPGL